MLAAKACKAYKFARPFYDPYQIFKLSNIGALVQPVDGTQVKPIRVAYN